MPSLKTPEFFDHIAREKPAPAYFLTGEEGYFIERGLAKIIDKALAGCALREFNLDVFYGRDSTIEAVIAQANTLPMMAERRVVVVKDADKIKDYKPFKEYMEAPAAETTIVLVAEGAERSKERTITTAVTGKGIAVHFYHPFEAERGRLIRMLAKDAGYNIDVQSIKHLDDALEGNLALIEAELRKVYNYVGEKKNISLADVKEAIGDFGLPVVFDLLDATAGKRPGKAMEVLSRLIRDGEAPLMLIGLMAGHWRRLLAAKEMALAGDTDDKLVKAFNLNFANKAGFLSQVKRLKMDELENAFGLFYRADKALKSSAVQPAIVIERLVFELASGAKR